MATGRPPLAEVARTGKPIDFRIDPLSAPGLSAPSIGALGHVAFAVIQNGRKPVATGLWVRTPRGKLISVAQHGNRIEVHPGEFRKVVGLQVVLGSGNEDGRSSGLNDRGELAFAAQFDDGSSGVFVSSAACR
ncbi:MAG: DUF7453 family protein [Planctomycetota bacterium]